jgi:ferrous iron transport protein B
MQDKKMTIGLVGNPNSGKTSLFNALTGSRQKVGNWPGVTVERKTGRYHHQGQEIKVVDLPGVYSLDSIAGTTSLDETIAHDYVLSHDADLIINIVDASNLERNLYLTSQLLEMQVPMIVVLNMMDALNEKGIQIDIENLQEMLGCPALPMVASRGKGVDALRQAIISGATKQATSEFRITYPEPVNQAVAALCPMVEERLGDEINIPWTALKLLEEDETAQKRCGQALVETATTQRATIEAELGEDMDIIAADSRYGFITEVVRVVVQRRERISASLSERIDRVVLNRVLGIPIFFLMIYLMFMFTINLGGAFIDFFDIFAGTIFVDGLGELLSFIGAPKWLEVLLATGLGGGIQTVATFIPIIGFLFLFLSFLEDSGYMARAAFVMDRFMRGIGLPGKSFVPLIVGFGCNVPAVMATRTLEGQRDRLMTMAMAPFMSCGARLPVYALFAAAFIPTGGQNLVFLLYLVGIAAAVLTGLALKSTLLPGEGSPFIMELPSYHLPSLRGLGTHSWARLNSFIFKAGKIIVPMVLLINVLNSIGTDGSFGNEDEQNSVLSSIGRSITPAFAPIGMSEENWPAAVGIFTGVLAKEAVVGTLDALYSKVAATDAPEAAGEVEPFSFWGGIGEAFSTIPENLAGVSGTMLDPLGLDVGDTSSVEIAAEEQEVALGTFGAMATLFGGTAAAFAYLLLVLLYFPCVAVIGAVYREAGMRWTAFISLWSTGLGYGVAVVFYQFSTFSSHPLQSAIWGAIVFVILGLSLAAMKQIGRREEAMLVYPVTDSVTFSESGRG